MRSTCDTLHKGREKTSINYFFLSEIRIPNQSIGIMFDKHTAAWRSPTNKSPTVDHKV